MEKTTLNRFRGEMRSLQALILLNIAGAGLAMSLGVSWVVTNIVPSVQTQTIQMNQLLLAGLVFPGCAIALKWLIDAAELFDGFDDLSDEIKTTQGDVDSDSLTRLIVGTMAWYRDRKTTITRLIFGSRVTGGFFILSAVLQSFNLISKPDPSVNPLILIAGLALCLVLGSMGLIVPTLVTRFTRIWDQRVASSNKAEVQLEKILEGP